MKIKSLLLGSAAALVAATGAQAADAIVVEPEPVEYVRICDAYGSGFFYIPGTETCIAFSGFVRSSYEKAHIKGLATTVAGGPVPTATSISTTTSGATVANTQFAPRDQSFTFWGQRARLNVDVRNETDWGTLRSQLRLEAGSSNTDADYDMDRALISIAGFRFGFTDNYWSTNHGYAWANFEGLGNTAGGGYIGDLWYGFDDATMADYTWAADGLAITIGAEDPRIGYGRFGFGNATNSGGADGRANFYAGFNWSAGIATLAGSAYFDSLATEYSATSTAALVSGDADGGWAYKVSLGLDLTQWIPGGSLWGMYMADGQEDTDYVQNYKVLANPESIWQVTYQMDLTSEVQLLAGYAHAEGTSYGNVITQAVRGEGDADQWSVGLNWYPAAAPGFHIKAAYFAGQVNGTRGFLNPLGDPNSGFFGVPAANYDFDGWTVSIRRDW